MIDPQTSGGLLVSLPAEQSTRAIDLLHDAGLGHAAVIGIASPAEDGCLVSIR